MSRAGRTRRHLSPDRSMRRVSAMKLTVNGQEREFEADASVRDLVKALGLGMAVVAVEVNRRLIPRAEHESTRLNEGDDVEIVTLVGGG